MGDPGVLCLRDAASELSWLRGFFSTIPESSIRGLRFICTDMWRQYMNVIAEKVENAVHIFNRFHVMKKFGDSEPPHDTFALVPSAWRDFKQQCGGHERQGEAGDEKGVRFQIL